MSKILFGINSGNNYEENTEEYILNNVRNNTPNAIRK
jgi:hypothetical protein